MDFATIRRVWLPLIIASVATGYIFKTAPGPHDWMRWLGLVLALIGIAEADAVALGAEFKQEAIFAFNRANRRVVSCTDTRVETTGWSSEPDPGSIPG